MKFYLIDKVLEITPTRIVAAKNVSLSEEYLADHFKSFPVLPGVMMLEALTQAAGWLLHVGSGFAKSMAVLREARNLRYGNFVAPGNSLRLEVEKVKDTEKGASFKATGLVDGSQALTGRLELSYFSLSERNPDWVATDANLIAHARHRWTVLRSQDAVSL